MKKIRHLIAALCLLVVLMEGILFVPIARAQISDGSGWAIFGIEVSKKVMDAVNWAWTNLIYPVLRDAVVKRIIDDMTNQIVMSIENGGQPQFLTDWKGYTGKATDIVFDSFNNQLMSQSGIDLCAPFRPQLQMYLSVNLGGTNRYPLGIPTRCSFDQFKQNIQDSSSFIKNGGWIGLQQVFLPSNNLIGASIALESSYYSSIAAEREKRTQEVNMGKGFLSVKKCVLYENIENPDNRAGVSATTFQQMATNWCNENNDGSSDCVERLKESNCKKEEVVTPGDTVAQAATEATISNFAYADNVQSIVSALVNVFIKNVFDKGKGLIFGSTGHGGSGLASNSLDFSSLSGNTINDQKISAQKTLRRIDNDYFLIQTFLKDGVLKKARTGRARAINAIYLCSLADRSFPAPWFGNLKYQPQSGMTTHAKLGDLVNYPFTFKEVDFPATEPELLSFVQRDLIYEAAAGRSGRVFPPAYDPNIPQKEGFYEKTITEATQALALIDKNRAEIPKLQTRLDAVDTATSTEKIINGRRVRVVVDSASSTAAISDILNKANTPYSDFINTYQKYVSEPLGGEAAGSGPGDISISGIGNALSKMESALVPGDSIDRTTAKIVGQYPFEFMFYCDPNR